MKKLDLLKDILLSYNISLSDTALIELIKIYSDTKPFLTLDEIENKELISEKLLNDCCGKFTYSNLTIDIFADAINRHVEIHGSIVRRTKREITDEMTKLQDLILSLINGKIPIKEINLNRSNINIIFQSRANGLGMIEIRNQGIIRLCVRNASSELNSILLEYNASVKFGANQDYYDFESTLENARNVAFIVLTYFYKV